jgi:hypothetical protein
MNIGLYGFHKNQTVSRETYILMTDNKKYIFFIGGVIIFIILFKFLFSNITFFWDAIACLSRPANFFYDNNLNTLIYSGMYDNGDPHLIPYLLASLWTFFGKSLLVTHVVFLPIVVGAVYQILKLCKNIFYHTKTENNFFIFIIGSLIILADPTVFTQIILLGIDLWVIFFGIYVINCILTNQKISLSLAFIGLCLTNRRGMIIAATLMIAYVIKIFLIDKRKLSFSEFSTTIIPTLPACFIVIFYIAFRFYYHGWVFSSPASVWSETSSLVNFHEFIRNCAVFVWRNIDFGRIFMWIVIFTIIIKSGFKKLFTKETNFLWICYFLLQIAFLCVTLPLTNPFGARYFTIQFILLGAIVTKLLFELFNKKQARVISVGLILALITGNLWLYPEKISQNWDCSLKHLPFYSLREECFTYMEAKNISYKQTAAGFCLYGDQRLIDLNEGNRIIQSEISEETDFFLYSNISNLTDDLIDELNSPLWCNIKSFEKNGIFIHLLKKNH